MLEFIYKSFLMLIFTKPKIWPRVRLWKTYWDFLRFSIHHYRHCFNPHFWLGLLIVYRFLDFSFCWNPWDHVNSRHKNVSTALPSSLCLGNRNLCLNSTDAWKNNDLNIDLTQPPPNLLDNDFLRKCKKKYLTNRSWKPSWRIHNLLNWVCLQI